MGNLSGIDWNGDGKNDLLDDLVDMQLIEEMEAEEEKESESGGSGGPGKGDDGGGRGDCGCIIYLILCVVTFFSILSRC